MTISISRCNRIPSAVLRPIVQAHVDEMSANEMGELVSGSLRQSTSKGKTNDYHVSLRKYSAVEALAFRAGVKRDTLYSFLGGDTQTISFDMADKILCAMHATYLWYEWPLVLFYLLVDLTDRPPSRSVLSKQRYNQRPETRARHITYMRERRRKAVSA